MAQSFAENDVLVENLITQATEVSHPGICVFHILCENNILKTFNRMYWSNGDALLAKLRLLLDVGFLYDDTILAFSRRTTAGSFAGRESYQFNNASDYYRIKQQLIPV